MRFRRLTAFGMVMPLVALMFFSMMPAQTTALVHYNFWTGSSGGFYCLVRGSTSSLGSTPIAFQDGNFTDVNVPNNNYNYLEYVVQSDFDWFAVSDVESEDGWMDYTKNSSYAPTEDFIVETVSVVFSGIGQQNAGWFSIGWTTGTSWYDSVPWAAGLLYWNANTIKGADNDSGIWKNTTMQSYHNWGVSTEVGFSVDITDMYEWNYSLLTSADLYVMWTQAQNASQGNIDFIGIMYDGYDEQRGFGYLPEVTTESMMKSLIWLLIIFSPAIIMQGVAPKIGFIGGMALTLGIISISNPDFIPMALIGFVGVGTLAYEGG